MGGLLIIFLFLLYLFIAYKVVRKVPKLWMKLLAVVVVVLLPTADAVYGRYHLKQMCAAEGGLHIYRTVEGVEGFMDTDYPIGLGEKWITTDGYRFFESTELSGKMGRLSLQPDGLVRHEADVMPISKYIVKTISFNPDPYSVWDRTETTIRVIATNEVLARHVEMSYAGGWVERFIARLYASRKDAADCGPIFNSQDITKILRPIGRSDK